MKYILSGVFASAIILGSAANTYAADQSIETNKVVVTPTKDLASIDSVGSSTTVITAEEIERKQYRDVVDAVRTVPGVTVRQNGGLGKNTSIFIRGTESDHVLLLVDGVQVHDVSAPNGAASFNHLLIDNIERIEVVRGPQSPLYGSDAIGGVIHVITKKGKGDPSFQLLAEGGSYDTFTEQVSSSGGTEDWYYSASATRVDSSGFSSQSSDGEDDGYQNTTLSSRFGFQTNEVFGTEAVVRFTNATAEFDSGENFDTSETDIEQFIAKVAPKLTLMDGKWVSKLSATLHNIKRDNQGEGFTLPSNFRGTIYGFDWQNTVELGDANTLIAGVEFEQQDAKNSTPNGLVEPDTYNVAYYLQDEMTFVDRLTAVAGLRLDDHDEFGEELTYRFAGAYDLKETETLLRASVGTGFRAPSLDQLFDTSFGSNNPDLDPEESIGFDVGFEQGVLDKQIRFGGTYFYNDIDDAIVNVFVDPGFQNINVEEIKTQGFETFVELQPCDFAYARLNYTYTDTEATEAASFGIEDGSSLLRRPRHEASADLTSSFLDGRGSATVTVHYVGRRKDLDPETFDTVRAKEYVVVDLSGSFELNDTVELFARVNNLFDEDYEEVLGFNTAGASAYGGLKIKL